MKRCLSREWQAAFCASMDDTKNGGKAKDLRRLARESKADMKEIADSCNLAFGGYSKMINEEILENQRTI